MVYAPNLLLWDDPSSHSAVTSLLRQPLFDQERHTHWYVSGVAHFAGLV